METNKSVKRALSLVLAMAMLVGSLFTANIGINTKVEAAAGTVLYWDGSKDTTLADKDETGADWKNAIIIDSAAELAQLALSEGNATDGKYYKMANGIGKIVLQNEAHAAEILAIANADQAATKLTGYSDKLNWNDSATFQGHFDGNGVAIYGLYSKSGDGNSALFPKISTLTSLENFAVRNSYVESVDSAAVLFARVFADSTGSIQAGDITVEKVEISNCYVKSTSNNIYRVGVMAALMSVGFVGLVYNNCLVYGNTAFNEYNSTKTVAGLLGMPCGWFNPETDTDATFSFTNSIILDCVPYSVQSGNEQAEKPMCFNNIYTNCVDPTPEAWPSNNIWPTHYVGKIIEIDAESIKGAMGKVIMNNLDWSTDEIDKVWYSIDGAYPTLFKPDGWKDTENIVVWDGTTATGFAGGEGTEEKPYIIETPDQLYKMVSDGGKTNQETIDGEIVKIKTYYKVKDGVKNLYLSNAAGGGYSAVKAVAAGTEGTDYHNWHTASRVVFEGNFDGNGVTIRGMISKSTDTNKNVGLVQILGNKAIVKNINFDTCYAYNSNDRPSALLASRVINYKDEDGDGADDDGGAKNDYNLVYNVSVRNSSIITTTLDANTTCAGLVCSYAALPDMLQMVNCLYDGYSCEMSSSDNSAGIASYNWSVNNFQASGCVSLGAPVVTIKSNSDSFNDYSTGKKSNNPVYLYNCYTDVAEVVDTTVMVVTGDVTSADYDFVAKMPLLDWANGWQVISDKGRNVPMPQVRTAADIPATWDTGAVVLDYNRWIGAVGGGATKLPYDGTYGHFDKLAGSGTESDPYLITNAIELARVIGAGGKNIHDKLYFKLSCDIDVSGMPWLNTVGERRTSSTYDTFTYVPFEGTLDGAGHAVIGLYAVNGNSDEEAFDKTDDWKAGLIPELNGGTIKNLHIRNSYAGTGAGDNTTGILVGNVGNFVSGNIEGCSVENSYVAGGKLVGNGTATITNSYIVNGTDSNNTTNTYYGADGNTIEPNNINVVDSKVWYKGGKGGATPKLLNRAQTMTCVDADGDGIGDGYGAGDLVAIRSKLLRKTAFKNIYADANHDGNTNITDLVIMRRYVINDYNKTADGFRRNMELGNISIYYAENDTQDMARSLELYFKSVYDTDVKKLALEGAVTDTNVKNTYTTLPTENYVHIVKNYDVSEEGYGKYSVEFDSAKNTLKVTGGSFTAVEQAVIEFIKNFDPVTGTLANKIEGSILDEKINNADKVFAVVNKETVANGTSEDTSYKARVEIPAGSGNYYYYAWGDEFDGSGTYSTNNWAIERYRYEDSEAQMTGKENPNLDSLQALWKVNDGRLTIRRGVNTDVVADASNYSWGYEPVSLGTGTNDWDQKIEGTETYVDAGLITTKKSMLFKQGYIEMEASLPSDGHAFPAWWFLTGENFTQNGAIDATLYNKVYKENNSSDWCWNGDDAIDPSNINTYKYQLPAAHLEFDIVEPMQQTNSGSSAFKYSTFANTDLEKGHYKRDFTLTVHKIYKENVNSKGLYIHNWANGTTTAPIAADEFVLENGEWRHRYNPSNYGGYTTKDYQSYTIKTLQHDASYNLRENMTKTQKYGFAWTVDEKTGTYSITLYINRVAIAKRTTDICEKDMVVNQTTGHTMNDPILGTAGKQTTDQQKADAAIWNQYAYMLLDNSFYTANSGSDHNAFTDLLRKGTSGYTNSGNYQISDKADFDINYVRVYQLDGRRDIVTSNTESFKNGNHFGYGAVKSEK